MAEPPKDPQKELERDLSELEERVDRLRASYEQYFMGYEKIEPGVQRKDVDRRFAMLRKMQIRNTAARYRFNVVTQKFNTYAMYWTRVCRQIEEGTFKRHIQKAERRFGGPGRRRDADYSIDVELGDFEEDFDSEDMDMDAALAEANAAAEAYALRGASDTVPPGSMPPGSRTDPPVRSAPHSSTSFAMTGQRETIGSTPPPDSEATPTPDAMRVNGGTLRAARGAALPPGAKGRVLLRRREDGPPPSTRNLHVDPNANARLRESQPGPIRPPMGSSHDRGAPPSTSVIRAAAVSGPQLPSEESRPALGRMPIAPPTQPGLGGPSPNRHVHAAAAAGPNRPPAIRPAAQSNPHLSPGAGSVRVPIRGPIGSSPQIDQQKRLRDSQQEIPTPASAMRVPGAPSPKAAGGDGRPAPAPSANRLPLPPPPARPAPSGPRLPVPTSSPRIIPPPASTTNAPPDSDQPRPSRRPPPALPSKHSTKKS